MKFDNRQTVYSFVAHGKRRFPIILGILFLLLLFYDGYSNKYEAMAAPQTVKVSPGMTPTWIKVFDRNSIIKTICETKDGGFIAAGRIDGQAVDQCQAWIVRLDAGGHIQWQRVFGDRDRHQFLKISETDDGGYFASGFINSGTDAVSGFLIKLSSRGETQWEKTIPGIVYGSFIQSSDGDLTLTGATKNSDKFHSHFILSKLGSDGRHKWSRITDFGMSILYRGHRVRQVSDGGYIVLCDAWSCGNESLIIKLDRAGNAKWHRQYHGNLRSIEQAKDGGYLFAGSAFEAVKDKKPDLPWTTHSEPPFHRYAQGWIIKLSRDGGLKWQKLYGGIYQDELVDIHRNREGHFIVLGRSRSYGVGNGDVWILKLDEDGDIMQQKTIGRLQEDVAYDLHPTKDGGYVIAGESTFDCNYRIDRISYSTSKRAWIAKVDDKFDIRNCDNAVRIHASNSKAEISADDQACPYKKREGYRKTSSKPFDRQMISKLNSPDRRVLIDEANAASLHPSAAKSDAQPFEPRAVNLCPPETGIFLPEKIINMGPLRRNEKSVTPLQIINNGFAHLEIKDIKLTQKEISISPSAKKAFSFTHDCTRVIPPGSQCAVTIYFSSADGGDSEALLEITSNDRLSPMVHVPVKATVVKE
ncbi:MAG: hypothetical protein K4571_04930 [Deltaproteobacteria bacterium]